MLAFDYVSVGAFVVVRNLGPLFSLGLELAIHPNNPTLRCDVPDTWPRTGRGLSRPRLRTPPTEADGWRRPRPALPQRKTVCATAAIAIGVVLYEAHDIKFSLIGTVLMLFNLTFAVRRAPSSVLPTAAAATVGLLSYCCPTLSPPPPSHHHTTT